MYVRTYNGMKAAPKDTRFELRLGIDERAMLSALSGLAGESEAVVVRQLIRQAFWAIDKQALKSKR